MRLTYPEYLAQKGTSALGRWCLFFGPEHLLKREALARLRSEAIEAAGGEEPSWEALEGADLAASDLLARCQTGALFAGTRVVVVHGAERMAEEEQEALARRVGRLPPGVSAVLVTAESEARRGQKQVKASLRRAIEGHGLAIEFAALRRAEAIDWAISRARELGKTLEPAAAHKLAEQKLGASGRAASLTALDLEIEKLASFVGDRGTISSSDVEEVTPRVIEEDIFRLVDAVAEQNSGRAVAVLRALLRDRREAPSLILAMIAQAMREIWQVKALLDHGWRPAARGLAEGAPGAQPPEGAQALLLRAERRNVLKVLARRPWQVSHRLRQANSFPWPRLARAMQALHDCDLALKGINVTLPDEHMALELLVIQLCRDLEVPLWDIDAKQAGPIPPGPG